MVDVDRQGFVDLLADRLNFTLNHSPDDITPSGTTHFIRLERASLELVMTTFRA